MLTQGQELREGFLEEEASEQWCPDGKLGLSGPDDQAYPSPSGKAKPKTCRHSCPGPWAVSGRGRTPPPQTSSGRGKSRKKTSRHRRGRKIVFCFSLFLFIWPLDPKTPGSCLFRESSAKSDILHRAGPASIVLGPRRPTGPQAPASPGRLLPKGAFHRSWGPGRGTPAREADPGQGGGLLPSRPERQRATSSSTLSSDQLQRGGGQDSRK